MYKRDFTAIGEMTNKVLGSGRMGDREVEEWISCSGCGSGVTVSGMRRMRMSNMTQNSLDQAGSYTWVCYRATLSLFIFQ